MSFVLDQPLVADNCGQTKARRRQSGRFLRHHPKTSEPRDDRPLSTDSSRLALPFSDTLTFGARRLPNNVQPATFVQLCTPKHVYLLNPIAIIVLTLTSQYIAARQPVATPNMVSDRWGCHALGVMLPKYSAMQGLELLCLRSTKPLQPPCYSSVTRIVLMLSPCAIESTTSWPSITFPKTLCRPSR